MKYYFEFGGGLGDIFYKIFCDRQYRFLTRLQPGDTARITILSVNPFAHELFDWHPMRDQLDVTSFPHWWPHEDAAMRVKYGLPKMSEISLVELPTNHVEFYQSDQDSRVIGELPSRPYFVIAASAGEKGRIFPDKIISMILDQVRLSGSHVVSIGRNYPEQRGGTRSEPVVHNTEYSTNLVDRLSIPGVAKLVENSIGTICSHSSVCLLSWFLNKPTCLLYPDEVYRRCVLGEHAVCEPNTGTMFGLDRNTTHHALFQSVTPEMIREFILESSVGQHG